MADSNAMLLGRTTYEGELRLMVHPLVPGGGKRLFEDGGEQETLELVSSATFGTGVVSLAYRPSGEKDS
jgi:dihydrofolate reductase